MRSFVAARYLNGQDISDGETTWSLCLELDLHDLSITEYMSVHYGFRSVQGVQPDCRLICTLNTHSTSLNFLSISGSIQFKGGDDPYQISRN